ncbi:MAG: AraC family transcriptional regulator [Deltaproteobacteria bacterium]|nr:AraC family transcriptional regulator [Deltaproteobacteria bacterium]
MSNGIWATVFAIGIVQGIFLVSALLLSRGTNRRATQTLAWLVGVFTLMILGGVLQQVLPLRLSQLVAYVTINIELAIGPLFLLLVRSILEPDRRRSSREALHFLPLTVGVIAWGLFGVLAGDRPRAFGGDLRPLVAAFVVFKASFLYAYLAATVRTLSRGLRQSPQFLAGRQLVSLEWFKRWIIGLGGLASLIYGSFFAEILGVDLPFESDQLGSLLLAVTIYLASLAIVLRPWLLSLKPRPAETDRWTGEATKLVAYLEQERPWLEPELGLADLAVAMGSTENHLSAVINEGLDTSFYGLLSRYRLAEFDRLARDHALSHRSVLDLAFQAGFNSKASFYRIFRKAHGMTPSAYRAAL